MKRIRYISRFASTMKAAAIKSLADEAAIFNASKDITGILIATGEVFFQIIEGPDREIDKLFAGIRQDPRHTDVLLLSVEEGNLTRLCPDWSMKSVDISIEAAESTLPLKALLGIIFDSRKIIADATTALERATWNMVVEAEMKEITNI